MWTFLTCFQNRILPRSADENFVPHFHNRELQAVAFSLRDDLNCLHFPARPFNVRCSIYASLQRLKKIHGQGVATLQENAGISGGSMRSAIKHAHSKLFPS